MNQKLGIIGVVGALALAAYGCIPSGSGTMGGMSVPSQTDVKKATEQLQASDGAKIVQASNDFGFKLFRLLATGAKDNVFISPTSISIALTMAYNGAVGQTAKVMASTLGIGGITLDQVDEGNRNLAVVLKGADPKVELSIANAMFARKDLTFKPEFLDRNQRFFGAEIEYLDFRSPDAVTTINQWVSDNTRGKIPKIVDQIDPSEMMHLINAVYFKGKWSDPFKKSMTQDLPFRSGAGEIKVPMMHRSDEFRYAKLDGGQIVSLPYGDGRLTMVIALPDETNGLSAMAQKLDADTWKAWTGRMQKKRGSVTIPRWKSEFSTSLGQSLGKLGMGAAFDPSADFGGMRSQKDIWIGDVIHKTFVQVDEEGTEAAAVTDVVMVGSAAPANPEKPFEFKADHPFFYSIQDSETGAVLFMGVVQQP